VGRSVILRGQPRPYHKERCPSAHEFWGFPSIMHTPFDAELSNLTWQHIWRWTFFSGSVTPPTQGGGVPALPNFGFLSIYAYTLYRKTTKFVMATHMGSGLVFRGQPRPQLKVAGPQGSPILGVPLYLCVHPLSQNYKISRREGRVSLGQPRLQSQERGVPWLLILWFCIYAYTL